MTNIASVKMEVCTREHWSLLLGRAGRKEQGGDIVLLRNQTIFVESLRSSMVVTRLSCLHIGLKGSDGLAVEQMQEWIGDVIITVQALNHALVTFAGKSGWFMFAVSADLARTQGWESRYPTASIKIKAHLGLALIFDAGLISDLSTLV
jgi:hypothetical protein